jgi:hypothetical protein
MILISSVALNIVVSGYLLKRLYQERIAAHFNRSVATIANNIVTESVNRYHRASDEHSPRTVLFNRILTQIFPDLMLPQSIASNATHYHQVIDHLLELISPHDVYHRYRTISLNDDAHQWLSGLIERVRGLDVEDFVGTVLPSILRQLVHSQVSVERYLLVCQYQHLDNLKLVDIDLDEDELENVEEAKVYVCQCGHVQVNSSTCGSCQEVAKVGLDYQTFINLRQGLTHENLTQCPITLNEFQPETEIGILSCGHYAERHPLLNWIQLNYRCHYAQCQIGLLYGDDEEDSELESISPRIEESDAEVDEENTADGESQ